MIKWHWFAVLSLFVAMALGAGSDAAADRSGWRPGDFQALAGTTGNQGVRIEAVLAGANGDARIQFVELTMQDNSQRYWAAQAAEMASRAVLTFHDATGLEVARYEFDDDAPGTGVADANGNYSVLVATAEFQTASGGIAADFSIPSSLVAVDGMVCFRNNPLNAMAQDVNQCLAYGNYVGGVESDGCQPARDNGLPELDSELTIASDPDVLGLSRVANDGQYESFGCYEPGGGNSDFSVVPVVARNNAGDTSSLVALSIPDQGRTLFELETFNGNGRTCASCHVEAFSFGLPPEHIADRFASDPNDLLFVNEFDAGLADLENTCLLRQGNLRGLNLENIDGFDMPPSFRATPHLLNIGLTAPYGLSGNDNLDEFSVGAIRQHLPRTLARNSDPAMGPIDFRVPTAFEQQALSQFQIEASEFPPPGTLAMDIGTVPNESFTTVDRDNFLDAMIAQYLADYPTANAADIAEGRALYFGETTGQCFRCHDGQALDQADGSLGPNNAADIVSPAGFPANADDGCSGGVADPDPALPPADVGRAFNNTPLIGIARTAPFFHDNSAATLREAVRHYRTGRFSGSPAGILLFQTVGTNITLSEADVDRIVDFLNAVSFVPEPTTGWLQAMALAAIGVLHRKRRTRHSPRA